MKNRAQRENKYDYDQERRKHGSTFPPHPGVRGGMIHGDYIAGGSASVRLVGIPLSLRRTQYPWPFSTVLNEV